jgi:hypothetical protein
VFLGKSLLQGAVIEKTTSFLKIPFTINIYRTHDPVKATLVPS